MTPDLWQRANQIIPGGNHLFSKTPLRYCPGKWPAYYMKAKGIDIQDLDGNWYKDFSVMGAGNSVLGYNDPDVLSAVMGAMEHGNVSTLNCYEEVELAEEILHLNRHMDMVRFGRSGNDACQIALRIAREYSGKQKFSICGYHGWEVGHPPQLDPNCTPFEYGNIEQAFKSMNKDTGAVIMEPVRSKPVDVPFLRAVRDLTDDLSIPLIFDEVASGFRCNLGGYHQFTNVKPDLVCYGKAMGNGYAISCVAGRRDVMKAALNTFISSMFWSERTGYAAGLATIEKMEKINAQVKICEIGKQVKKVWRVASDISGLPVEISGIDPLATFAFVGDEGREKITTFTQEMLKRGFLAAGQFYASVCHTPGEIEAYADAVNEVFADIAAGKAVLEGEPAIAGFIRLA